MTNIERRAQDGGTGALRARAATLAACLLVISPACSSSSKPSKWSVMTHSGDHWVKEALESDQADERRRGVIGLSESRHGDEEWAWSVFEIIARKDQDAMVRCAALRALAAFKDARQTTLALGILDSVRNPTPDVRTASPPVRWEAARLLLAMMKAGAYDDDLLPGLTRVAAETLKQDEDRNVRITVAEALGYVRDRAVVEALIDCMDKEDYAFRCAAGQSLCRLTGQTHEPNPGAWRAWLNGAADPFEQAHADAGRGSRRRWKLW